MNNGDQVRTNRSVSPKGQMLLTTRFDIFPSSGYDRSDGRGCRARVVTVSFKVTKLQPRYASPSGGGSVGEIVGA